MDKPTSNEVIRTTPGTMIEGAMGCPDKWHLAQFEMFELTDTAGDSVNLQMIVDKYQYNQASMEKVNMALEALFNRKEVPERDDDSMMALSWDYHGRATFTRGTKSELYYLQAQWAANLLKDISSAEGGHNVYIVTD